MALCICNAGHRCSLKCIRNRQIDIAASLTNIADNGCFFAVKEINNTILIFFGATTLKKHIASIFNNIFIGNNLSLHRRISAINHFKCFVPRKRKRIQRNLARFESKRLQSPQVKHSAIANRQLTRSSKRNFGQSFISTNGIIADLRHRLGHIERRTFLCTRVVVELCLPLIIKNAVHRFERGIAFGNFELLTSCQLGQSTCTNVCYILADANFCNISPSNKRLSANTGDTIANHNFSGRVKRIPPRIVMELAIASRFRIRRRIEVRHCAVAADRQHIPIERQRDGGLLVLRRHRDHVIFGRHLPDVSIDICYLARRLAFVVIRHCRYRQ